MSIVRVGLSERQNFSEGYEAIFGKKKAAKAAAQSRPSGKTAKAKKKSKSKK
jgi:hypothetical protein